MSERNKVSPIAALKSLQEYHEKVVALTQTIDYMIKHAPLEKGVAEILANRVKDVNDFYNSPVPAK